jgi:hypothetical protein
MLDGRDPAISKLLMGGVHVRAFVAAGRLDEAALQLSAFEQLASACQSGLAVSDASELRAAMSP